MKGQIKGTLVNATVDMTAISALIHEPRYCTIPIPPDRQFDFWVPDGGGSHADVCRSGLTLHASGSIEMGAVRLGWFNGSRVEWEGWAAPPLRAIEASLVEFGRHLFGDTWGHKKEQA